VRFADAAGALLEIAQSGLKRLDPLDAPLLDPLRQVAHEGRSPAEAVLDQWRKDPDPVRLLDRFPP
ncbi:MAG TPA: hypothetical protein VEM39_04330, partial [Myxococcaceae bacterium]|nr:hypothetical protein [Myxococcaceae bacterium]